MRFWGVEVKNGQTLPVKPGGGMVLHLKWACVVSVEKDEVSESVLLYVKVKGGKKILIGILNLDNLHQHKFDFLFDEKFELSHNLKSGSVYFYGYTTANPWKLLEAERLVHDIFSELANINGKAVESSSEDTMEESDCEKDEEYNSETTKKDEDKSDKEESNMETTKKRYASKKRPAGSATKTPDLTKNSKTKSATQKTDGKKAVHAAGNKRKMRNRTQGS